MQFIPKNRLLEYRPDTLMSIRKEYNLDKPGMMEDAIRIMREWVKKQQHFRKKDFPDAFFETTIIACKGSIERAKTQIDRLCTLRTLLPHFFGPYNVKTDFGILFDVINLVVLPKLTPDHNRVVIVKVNDKMHLIKDHLKLFIFLIIFAEYMKLYEYCRGFYAIVDFTELNIMDMLANFNPVQLRQFASICIEGYGMRLNGIHIFTNSKLIDTVITILKQLCSPKVTGRIHCYKSLEILPKIVPLDILPEDYGGKERSMKVLLENCLDVLSSKENLDYLKDMDQATTDESFRQTAHFNEHYAGMPGTFKILNID